MARSDRGALEWIPGPSRGGITSRSRRPSPFWETQDCSSRESQVEMRTVLGEYAHTGVSFMDGQLMRGFEKRWRVRILVIASHYTHGSPCAVLRSRSSNSSLLLCGYRRHDPYSSVCGLLAMR